MKCANTRTTVNDSARNIRIAHAKLVHSIAIFWFPFISDGATEAHLQLELQHSMRLFRAQRNFYISGFSIFLTLVIRRLVILISAQAQLLAQSEASMRQAQSATTAARSLLSQQKTNDDKDEKAKDNGKSDELVRTSDLPPSKFLKSAY